MANQRPKGPPSAASRITDEESSNEGGSDELRRSLYALDAMRARGLIDEATFQARRSSLLAADPGTGDEHGSS